MASFFAASIFASEEKIDIDDSPTIVHQLLARSSDSAVTCPVPVDCKKPVVVFACNGGGIKGYIETLVLQTLSKETEKEIHEINLN